PAHDAMVDAETGRDLADEPRLLGRARTQAMIDGDGKRLCRLARLAQMAQEQKEQGQRIAAARDSNDDALALAEIDRAKGVERGSRRPGLCGNWRGRQHRLSRRRWRALPWPAAGWRAMPADSAWKPRRVWRMRHRVASSRPARCRA